MSDAVTVDSAVESYLSSPQCANQNTHRAYRSVLDRLAGWLGGHRPLTEIGEEELTTALRGLWGSAAAATWNRNRAAVAGWLAWCRARGEDAPTMPDAVERRPDETDPTAILPREAIERLLLRPDLPLRERTLWRLLYETAGRTADVLALDVEDLNLRRRRAGDLRWDDGSAYLLPRLIAGRSRGPLFLSERRPPPARRPPRSDLCPYTGRARLGYDRARILLDQHTRTPDGGPGWDLRQLRLSALAHRDR
ncbi:site-specific integrase [Cryptosporangium aurantiacum]|uniref:Phage integrase, N-terminal SAM-like domain n=1 Tax=Cryptosporangium aurantiacum TaxID=134849 RepID=A0A1M7JJM1_9ACTN|nr:site-specific integrase [Cryptosporangium aurantiacum]SHM53242.1 Phage integrase, N-terminal SAM-like domain [Cryptosporangium aurantiacum]